MSDTLLSIIVPVIVYWATSIPFDILDYVSPKFLVKYRINESPEVVLKNRVSKAGVVMTVISQQIIQTIMGLWWLEESRNAVPDHCQIISQIQINLAWFAVHVLGVKSTVGLLSLSGPSFASWVYWWGIPILQFTWAVFVIDAWQYALHRLMHSVPFLYKHLHSWHHRIYIPYAYGALYNHPIEGILMDIIGALLAFDLSGMSPRQGCVLFGISTAKTVHDHCGWSLPWDPMQFLFKNNAAYHDIHHQTIGIKHNFSQPFFVVWDSILGTQMTKEEMEARKAATRAKIKAA